MSAETKNFADSRPTYELTVTVNADMSADKFTVGHSHSSQRRDYASIAVFCVSVYSITPNVVEPILIWANYMGI